MDNLGNLVAGTDQASRRILLLDPEADDWSSDEAVRWSWAACTANGFDGLEAYWGVPTDVKVRNNPRLGEQAMIVTDSLGLAAMLPFPAGDRKLWGCHVGGNPHSAELLPNGNVAVAASTGGWVRIYASSQGPSCADYAEYAFAGAHGVHWDPGFQLLWVLGDDELVGLRVEGTDAKPEVRPVCRTLLPSRFGHDLQPVYGDRDRLWVSTGTQVYQYVKSADRFDSDYPGRERISREDVKSIGNLASGQTVSTVPKPGGTYEWTTDTAEFHCPDRVKIRSGAGFYKMRVLNSEYE
ncbi:DUF6528 family protein [Paenibacillus sp. GYB004]|uniref:DUF6528 family protein n=1 Tax=Paenibacillus sp. GYB004 TaxID=2994393 RepID=UPI002F96A130